MPEEPLKAGWPCSPEVKLVRCKAPDSPYANRSTSLWAAKQDRFSRPSKLPGVTSRHRPAPREKRRYAKRVGHNRDEDTCQPTHYAA